jgi:lactocepin
MDRKTMKKGTAALVGVGLVIGVGVSLHKSPQYYHGATLLRQASPVPKLNQAVQATSSVTAGLKEVTVKKDTSAEASPTTTTTKSKKTAEKSQNVVVSVTLKAKAAADLASTPQPDGSKASLEKIAAAEKAVVGEQAAIREQAEKITGKKVTKTNGYLVNTFTIETPTDKISELEKIDGVKTVTTQVIYHSANTNDNELAEVTDDWRQKNSGDGRGIVIADIDSGIDSTHKDLKLTEAGTKAAKISQGATQWFNAVNRYGTYRSAKVPFAHNYASNSDAVDALKDSGVNEDHGMHVRASWLVTVKCKVLHQKLSCWI